MSDGRATPMDRYRYVIDEADLLEWVSEEWLDFARKNAWEGVEREELLGHSVWEFVGGTETKHLYGLLFERARSEGRVLSVPFRCDAPELRRFMELTITPLDTGALEMTVATVNEEDRPPVRLLSGEATRSDEFVTMCSWCKQVRTGESRWEEVEAAIKTLELFEADGPLPEISHGVCPTCHERVMNPPEGSGG